MPTEWSPSRSCASRSGRSSSSAMRHWRVQSKPCVRPLGTVGAGNSSSRPSMGLGIASSCQWQPGLSPPLKTKPRRRLASLLGVPDAERRQLTIMVCNLRAEPPLARHLDPDDLYAVLRPYQETCARIVQQFDGQIAQYRGEELVVYFGYPQAHDDDAQRAVRAGLKIVEAFGELHPRLEREPGLRWAVRVGVHTGLVVVGALGDGGPHDRWALGDTPSMAAQLHGLAAPDTVVISTATQRLLQGYF